MSDTFELLATWTPFMLGGFGWNILIAVVATAIGTLVGAAFALLRLSSVRAIASSAAVLTSFFRNVPTLVLLFYLATLMPNEISLFDGLATIEVPAWLKASLALSASPIGFTSWNLAASILAWRRHDRRAAILFIPNWLGGFLITVLASSVSSLVGVPELVGRSNSIINATGSHNMLAVYLYASCFFLAFCSLSSFGLDRLKRAMIKKYS